MTTDILDSSNLTESDFDHFLDQLFASARSQSQQTPSLNDDNFTKLVVNGLPSNPLRSPAKRYYPDLIGLLLGLVATLLVIEPAQIMSSVLSLLPSNILISFKTMLMVSFVSSCLACLAWWSVEHSQPSS